MTKRKRTEPKPERLTYRLQTPISPEMRERLAARVVYPDTMAAFVRRLIERELAS